MRQLSLKLDADSDLRRWELDTLKRRLSIFFWVCHTWISDFCLFSWLECLNNSGIDHWQKTPSMKVKKTMKTQVLWAQV